MVRLPKDVNLLQGYLAHKKTPNRQAGRGTMAVRVLYFVGLLIR